MTVEHRGVSRKTFLMYLLQFPFVAGFAKYLYGFEPKKHYLLTEKVGRSSRYVMKSLVAGVELQKRLKYTCPVVVGLMIGVSIRRVNLAQCASNLFIHSEMERHFMARGTLSSQDHWKMESTR